MHFKLFRSTSEPADPNLFQNADYDEPAIFASLGELDGAGHTHEIVEPHDDDWQAAMHWAANTRTPVVHSFGSKKYPWSDFGKRVPALYAYEGTDLASVHPHIVGDGYATIAQYLGSFPR